MRYVVFGLCVFAAACGGEIRGAPTSPSSAIGAAAVTEARGGSELPFRGSLEAVEVHTGLPPVLHSVLTGTGQATHLGRFTATLEFDIQLGVMMPSTTIGSFTLIAANRDSVSGTLTGRGIAVSGVVTIVETATITEGTGRFANATGSFTIDRVANQTTLVSSGSFDGIINLARPLILKE